MEQNKNLLYWRKACRIGAYADLALQILGIIGMIVVSVLFLPIFSTPEMEWMWMPLIAIPIVLLLTIHFLFLACAITMIIGASEGREAQDALKTTTRWKTCQYVLLFLACALTIWYWKTGQWVLLVFSFSGITRGYWEAFVFSSLIRIPLIIIGTQFINELKTETKKSRDNFEARKRTGNTSEDVGNMDDL